MARKALQNKALPRMLGNWAELNKFIKSKTYDYFKLFLKALPKSR